MEIFKTVTVFEVESGDVFEKMCESISYVQITYCFPYPSEYFFLIQEKASEDRSYIEHHIYFHNEEKYKEWYSVFGEITEELVDEFKEDFEKKQITHRRFFDNVEVSGAARAEPMNTFQSKFNENYKDINSI